MSLISNWLGICFVCLEMAITSSNWLYISLYQSQLWVWEHGTFTLDTWLALPSRFYYCTWSLRGGEPASTEHMGTTDYARVHTTCTFNNLLQSNCISDLLRTNFRSLHSTSFTVNSASCLLYNSSRVNWGYSRVNLLCACILLIWVCCLLRLCTYQSVYCIYLNQRWLQI